METRILLGGGGSERDERPVFELFASWVGPSGSVLYLPVAAIHPGKAHLDWARSVLSSLGVRRIDMWTTLMGHAAEELDAYTAIFMGGGNTYRLLAHLRRSRLDEAIRGFAAAGRIVYGGSAGAIVLGRDIATCAHMDKNVAGLVDISGLDLVGGDAVWCHYRPDNDALIRAYVERTQTPTVALAETAGLWVRGCGDNIPLGSGAAYRFTPDGRHRLLA